MNKNLTNQEIECISKLLMNLFLDGITPEEAMELVGPLAYDDYKLVRDRAMELMKTYINHTKGI